MRAVAVVELLFGSLELSEEGAGAAGDCWYKASLMLDDTARFFV